ncbi:STN domain-containing protein [Horticoccus luteus]|uniref:STN domain-containing protein n=1 Tax=Horticoccus luteus TaxID=2862869 RepID=A0A8F9XHR8_9BACT|nr:STN domain-containing protein [Horticoccus luteus]QYM79630.1 STN domain-containing protein [Horticoccus luteus]
MFVAALALVRAVGAPEEEARHHFDIPAGAAETTLRKFSKQAGEDVVFPKDLVRDVRTAAVRGDFEAQEALERMTQGTPLVVSRRSPKAALVLARRADSPAQIIALPPYLVEDSVTPPWRYAQAPGLEVISRCPDDFVSELVATNDRLRQLLELILPARLQWHSDVPTAYVLLSDQTSPAATRELLAKLQERATSGAEVTVRTIPNYRFADADALAVFFIFNENLGTPQQLVLTPGYLRYLMENRVPALPRWFVEGLLKIYENAQVTTTPFGTSLARADTAFFRPRTDFSRGVPPAAEDRNRIVLPPVTWSALTASGKKDDDAEKAGWMPLAALLAEGPAQAEADPTAVLRGEEAALLIRWALDDAKGERAEALWRFVDACSRAPAAERAFTASFGLTYAEAETQLRKYLPSVGKKSVVLRRTQMDEAPTVELRDATAEEVARLKGDLSRLEVGYIREFQPVLTEKYLAQAQRVLRRAYDRGDRDPRLLAIMGLCACDAGDDAAARPLLEAAAGAGVVRPRVYFELARIVYAEARAHAAGGELARAEQEQVLRWLAAGRRQAPALPQVYDLYAALWLQARTRLERGDLAVLDEGLALFPRRVRLIYGAAMLNALSGEAARAVALTQQGLALAPEATMREHLEKLQAVLTTAEAAETKKGR